MSMDWWTNLANDYIPQQYTDLLDRSASKTELKATFMPDAGKESQPTWHAHIQRSARRPPPSEQNDVDEDIIDVDEEPVAAEPDYVQPQLRRPFELLDQGRHGAEPHPVPAAQ